MMKNTRFLAICCIILVSLFCATVSLPGTVFAADKKKELIVAVEGMDNIFVFNFPVDIRPIFTRDEVRRVAGVQAAQQAGTENGIVRVLFTKTRPFEEMRSGITKALQKTFDAEYELIFVFEFYSMSKAYTKLQKKFKK